MTSAFPGSKLLSVNAVRSWSRLNVRKDLAGLGYADGLCRELDESKDRNDREDESQTPDED